MLIHCATGELICERSIRRSEHVMHYNDQVEEHTRNKDGEAGVREIDIIGIERIIEIKRTDNEEREYTKK